MEVIPMGTPYTGKLIIYQRLKMEDWAQEEDPAIIIRRQLLAEARIKRIDANSMARVGHQRWNYIAQDDGPGTEIATRLYDIGKGLMCVEKLTSVSCGEEIYCSIRPTFRKHLSGVPSEKSKKPIPKAELMKTTKKADLIKQKNIIAQVKKEVDAIIAGLTLEPLLLKEVSFKSRYVEVQFMKMMVQCRALIETFEEVQRADYKNENLRKLAVTPHRYNVAEMIVGFTKIINEKKDQDLSKTCLKDMIDYIEFAKKVIKFDVSEIISSRPDLVFKTIYDTMLVKKQNGMYQSQKDIFDFVTSNDNFLAVVHTMLGSGKTSMIIPLCGWVSSLKTDMKLVFSCPNEAVLFEVAHMVYGCAVPFAIVIYNSVKQKLDYKFSSFATKKKNEDPEVSKAACILYICDMYVTRILFKERAANVKQNKKVPEYFCIFDEPTIEADSQKGFIVNSGFSLTTELFVKNMQIAPPKIMLMSATLPTTDQMPKFYESITAKHETMVTKSFASHEAKIGCSLISSSGELFTPHANATSPDQLKQVLKVIQSNPLIGRFYTFDVIVSMVKTFKELSLPVPDLPKMFEDASLATQTNIQKIAYGMLETLMEKDSETITKACGMTKNSASTINTSKIFTTDFPKIAGGCLVFSSDPIATAINLYHSNFGEDIFDKIRFDSIMDNYERDLDLHKKEIARLESKKDESKSKKNHKKADDEEDKHSSGSTERASADSWQKISKLSEQRPVWTFPETMQVGSPEHAKKYGISTPAFGGCIGADDIPESKVPIQILTMLASGIGVYSTSTILDDEYLGAVLALAKRGLVKIIVADSKIAYGTNLSVSSIIMIDEPTTTSVGTQQMSIVNMHSIKTLIQMMARAGRAGLSYEARIYTVSKNNELINQLLAYIAGTLDEGKKDEVANIQRAYEILW